MKRSASWRPLASLLGNPLVTLASAGLLLGSLVFAADWRKVAAALAALDARYLAAALAMFVPLTLLSALRWKAMVRHIARISLADALRHTLIASSWNLLIPAKLGDFSKVVLLPPQQDSQNDNGLGAALTEKIVDAAMLLLLVALGASGQGGWLLAAVLAATGARALQREWRLRSLAAPDSHPLQKLSWAALLGLSLALWALHLVQIDLMLKAAGVFVPWSTAIARLPLALFAGLVPISFCGIGTRDAALAVLFSDVASASTMAAVGMLTALRYLVPGAVGIPLQAAWRKRREMQEPVDGVPNQPLPPPHLRTAHGPLVSSR